jgi:hypothetical protein
VDGGADDLARAALVMARQFAAGGTLWCLAPSWPDHARHAAVEFVHPVIVGKRALPAVSIDDPDPVAVLRARVRPGDLLLCVSTAREPTVRAVLHRARAWGLTTIWVGAGPPPEPGAADAVLWVDGEPATAPHDGRLVLQYHLLWELAHVCFEHPGLLRTGAACEDGPVCTTCSDEGRLAEVVAVTGASAAVRSATGVESVDLTLVGEVVPGDVVLVHAGQALVVLQEGVVDA